MVGEVPWSPAKAKAPSPKRLVWAHDPQRAAEQSQQRQARMEALLTRAEQCVAKLDAQDAGQTAKCRKLSDAGAKARLYHEVIEARLGRIIEVDLKHEQLSWKVNEDHLAQARLMDGKLLLVTNVADLTPAEVVQRYKSLADIERGFHVLKSQIEIAPMFHRLGPAPRHADAAEGRRQQGFARAGACAAAPVAAPPRASGGRPNCRRLVHHQLRTGRAVHFTKAAEADNEKSLKPNL